MWMRTESASARARLIQTRVILDCQTTAQRLRSVKLTCALEEAAMSAAPEVAQEAPSMEAVLRDTDALLSKAWLKLRLSRDGRLLDVEVAGLPEGTEAERQTVEALTHALSTAVSGLDLQTASDGASQWRQPHDLLPLNHSAIDTENNTRLIRSHGDGYLDESRSIAVTLTGTAEVSSDGTILGRLWSISAQREDSPQALANTGWLTALSPGETPFVGESGLWDTTATTSRSIELMMKATTYEN